MILSMLQPFQALLAEPRARADSLAHLHLKESAEDVAPTSEGTTSTALVRGGSGGRGLASISAIISTVLPCSSSPLRFSVSITP